MPAPDHLETDAAALVEKARTYRSRTYQVLWGPGRRGSAPGWRVERGSMTVAYAESEPWRLVGVYDRSASAADLAEDLRAWREEYQHVV